ncbi:MAG: adenylyl-sulfate kinase [Candidatus Omnitrophota bacterium]
MRRGLVFWFTGLSGSGKTTVALKVKNRLESNSLACLIVDGDLVRAKHVKPLGFCRKDIQLNNIIIAGHCLLNRDNYDIILVPVISPLEEVRAFVRKRLTPNFYLVYFSADLKSVIRRDVKKLYQKAQDGLITNMIGFSSGSPYEAPLSHDLIIDSSDGRESVDESVEKLYSFIVSKIS